VSGSQTVTKRPTVRVRFSLHTATVTQRHKAHEGDLVVLKEGRTVRCRGRSQSLRARCLARRERERQTGKEAREEKQRHHATPRPASASDMPADDPFDSKELRLRWRCMGMYDGSKRVKVMRTQHAHTRTLTHTHTRPSLSFRFFLLHPSTRPPYSCSHPPFNLQSLSFPTRLTVSPSLSKAHRMLRLRSSSRSRRLCILISKKEPPPHFLNLPHSLLALSQEPCLTSTTTLFSTRPWGTAILSTRQHSPRLGP